MAKHRPTHKTCAGCGERKPLDDFNLRKSNKTDGRQPRCRRCTKAWYQANRESHIRRCYKNEVRARHEKRQKILAYLADHPCIDCGIDNVIVLQFDHRDPGDKSEAVSSMLRKGRAWRLIVAEIEKCDVRCANCHTIRASIQFDWRYRRQFEDGITPEPPTYAD